MDAMTRQQRSIRAEFARCHRGGGARFVAGRKITGGSRRVTSSSYWARRFRLAPWFCRVARMIQQRTVWG